jgi:hypothetical protein
LQSSNESSLRQRELIQLIVVVVLIGLISNIVASYLATYSFYGISVGVWSIPFLVLLVLVSVYFILNPKVVSKVAIYANLMVDKKNRCLHFSKFSPIGIQRAVQFWKAMEQDKSPYSSQIILQLHQMKGDLGYDFFESIVFLTLVGFEPFWASNKIRYYGYQTHPSSMGEETNYADSTIFRIQKTNAEIGSILNFKNLEFRDLSEVLKDNQVIKHFLGNSSLDWVLKPDNWMIFTPKGTRISIEHKKLSRVIMFSHRYFTAKLIITENSVALGLPYGIGIKEENYDESRFFSTDFRIDFEVSFSNLLLINWRRGKYYNWSRLLREKLVASLALDKTELIREIE